MLAGQPPFTGPTAMALLARHSLDNVPSLKIVRGTVPDAVEDAIVRAMAKVPADRFHSATDFAEALTDNEGAIRRRADSLKAKAIAAETVERPALGGGRKKMVMIAAAVAVPLLAVGGWFGYKATQNAGGGSPAGLEGRFAKTNIAVLYFDDRSPGKQLAYLADGLTEAVIGELSAVKQLKVISRNGVAPLKGKNLTPDSIAKLLSVGTLVTGRVTPRPNNRVRVEVELTDAMSGDQKGSTSLEDAQENMIALQDSLARQLSISLRRQVGAEVEELASRVGTRNTAAWDALQRARQTINEIDVHVGAGDVPGGLAKIAEADSQLARVESLDKNWREPIVQRAWLGYRAARLIDPTEPGFKKYVDDALANAERALRMSPTDADATEARGTLHYWQWLNNGAANPAAASALLESAEKDLVAATTANPRAATAWNVLSHLRINKGNYLDGKAAALRAYEADPYLTDVDRTIYRLFSTSLDLGDRVEATKWCTEGENRFPGAYRFIQCRLSLYALPGPKPNMAEVWKTYDEFLKSSPKQLQEYDKLRGKLLVALAFVRAGQPDSAMALAAANQGDSQVDPSGDLTNFASIVYAQAGDKETALQLYAKYLAMNPQQRAFAANDKVTWWMKDLRSDPRYQALVKGSN